MSESEDRWFTKQNLTGAVIAVLMLVAGGIWTSFSASKPQLEVRCVPTALSSPAFSEQYVEQVKRGDPYPAFSQAVANAKVAGELKCVVTNVGSKKAENVNLSYAMRPSGFWVDNVSLPSPQENAPYHRDSVNPREGFTAVAQFNYAGLAFDTEEPKVTLADSEADIEIGHVLYGWQGRLGKELSERPWLMLFQILCLLLIGIPSYRAAAYEISKRHSRT